MVFTVYYHFCPSLGDRTCVCLILLVHPNKSLMNLHQAQSEARHYVSHFDSIVLFVNQCLLITAAVIVAACVVFFPLWLNTHSLWFCYPQQSININSFRGITKCTHEAMATHLCCTCNQSEICPSLSDRRTSYVTEKKHTHPHTDNLNAPPKQK